ncbi:glycoside hydrolase family 16 protein [Collybiopsis luxurians FD-317 M1]|nr:glycoside hydrolase family 16 protein [Collybiopsis luxurians FD-317 M1]
MLSRFLLATAGIELSAASTTYDLIKDYSGSRFFNDWDFYGNYDNLTNGDAIFVTEEVATSDKLAYVDSATNHAIIKVDNTTEVAYNYKRNTVRIASNDYYEAGSLWIADMYHVPYGCSVWPAWWSQAPDWPTGGEIDTFEGVNMVTHNQMTLHTEPGCTQKNPQTSTIINSTDCSYEDNDNEGCAVTDSSTSSYGSGFSAAEGGVFVTEFATTGISVWFFPRSSVPDSISSNTSSISISDLGTPTANWPSTGCSIDEYFSAQQLIFDITLCGDYAGETSVFSQTCTGTCYTDYVIGDPSTYDNAYFEIASVRVYGANGQNTTTSSNRAPPASDSWTLSTSAVILAGFGFIFGSWWEL